MIFRKTLKSGLNIGGEQLNYLHFSDYLVFIAGRASIKMLRKLNARSVKGGVWG